MPAREHEPLRREAGGLSTLLFHKPYGILSQFSEQPGSRWSGLAEHIDRPGVYAAGRLDADSEGLLLLTSNGQLQHRLTDPRWGHWRSYQVQVEGRISEAALAALARGVTILGSPTRAARAWSIASPPLADRIPPIRQRRAIPTSWLQLELQEGRNRQVRRMTAAVGFPTLRLVRVGIDLMDGGPPLALEGLGVGQWREVTPAEQQRLQALLAQQPLPQEAPGRAGRLNRSRR